jgi:hypothetical protein
MPCCTIQAPETAADISITLKAIRHRRRKKEKKRRKERKGREEDQQRKKKMIEPSFLLFTFSFFCLTF